MKNFKNILSCFLCFLIVGIIISSCNDNNLSTSSTNNNQYILAKAISGNFGNPFAEDFKKKYNNDRLIGVISMENIHYNILDLNDSIDSFSQLNYAVFVDDNQKQSISINNLININNTQIIYKNGIYESNSEIPSILNFPGTNKIFIKGIGLIEEDSIIVETKSKPIKITNISFNQNISRNQDLEVIWSGGKVSELAQMFLFPKKNIGIITSSSLNYVSKLNSNNSLTISSSELKKLQTGTYYLLLYTYEPTYKTLRNGKQILAMSVFAYQLEFNLIN